MKTNFKISGIKNSSITIQGSVKIGRNITLNNNTLIVDGEESHIEDAPEIIINNAEGATVEKISADILTINGNVTTAKGDIVNVKGNVLGDVKGDIVNVKGNVGSIDM